MSVSTPKPPPLVLGVKGIEPKPIVLAPAPEQAIDWRALSMLPPFQMFAHEKAPNRSGIDSAQHALAFVRGQGGGRDLFDSYCQWHAEKGYWADETPTGKPMKG